MKKIGLTGGMGSGKSTVAQMLREYGFVVIDADAVAREVVHPGSYVLERLAKAFGADILQHSGELNRGLLAQRAFASPAAIETLNAITHPAIEQRTAELFAQAAGAGAQLVIWDMPLLIEKGYHRDMDAVIVVDVAAAERIRRLVTYRGMDAADAAARIGAQVSDEQRRAVADYLIDNNTTKEALHANVAKVARHLHTFIETTP
ncbi:dephospho-CoA kinase [Corynebacterium sp. HS2168-gen11]|uniref:dephospho-CoA kinase n=1 Tax=Corynebacterium sp. HS2168-gen11 TaxID=2974027 RepID=UPI00216B23E1|nr:dephospho-CoA kinase [Corynebacterium sp. HS2168-gen11]MCS4534782.1 dephospho-CoA kinase [Corynebacterium sp. HS2168-gen11]